MMLHGVVIIYHNVFIINVIIPKSKLVYGLLNDYLQSKKVWSKIIIMIFSMLLLK